MGMKNFLARIFKRASVKYGDDAWLGRPNNIATGRNLGPNDALKISAFYAGLRYLSETTAMLPIVIYKKLPNGGKERNPDHDLWRILRQQPNPLMDAFQFKEMIMVHLVMRGNFYAQKILNGRGHLLELYPLCPDNVEPFFRDPEDEDSLAYRISLPKYGQIIMPPKEIVHIRGLGVGGLKGLSPIDLMMQTIGIATAQEEHAASFFGRGVRASGVLEHPNRLTKEAADRIRNSFDELYSGSSNSFRTILLEEGLKWNQVSMTGEQSQTLQSRQFTVTDIARWMRVPPHKIGDLSRSTNNNIEWQGQEAITDSLGPWFTRIESALLRQCTPEREWEETVIEFLVDALLRGDIKTRYEAYSVARNNGFLNVDEIRARENLNPLPDGKGQIFLEPLNMKPVGEDPPQNDPNQNDSSNDSPPNDQIDPSPDQINSWKIVFESQIQRALRREITARGRKNSDNGKMFDFLTTELESSVRASLNSWIGLLPPSSNRERMFSDIKTVVPNLISRYANDWCSRSNEGKESFEKWIDDKRWQLETDSLVNLINETYRGIRDGHKA